MSLLSNYSERKKHPEFRKRVEKLAQDIGITENSGRDYLLSFCKNKDCHRRKHCERYIESNDELLDMKRDYSLNCFPAKACAYYVKMKKNKSGESLEKWRY